MHVNQPEKRRENFNGKVQKTHLKVRKRMNKMKKIDEHQWTISQQTVESCKHEGNSICSFFLFVSFVCHSVCICQSLRKCSSMRPRKPLRNEEYPWRQPSKKSMETREKGKKSMEKCRKPMRKCRKRMNRMKNNENKQWNMSRIMETWRKSSSIFTKWDLGDSN